MHSYIKLLKVYTNKAKILQTSSESKNSLSKSNSMVQKYI